jgi:1,2-diacylglycerol 3-beta-galactosyltransferase
MVKPKVDLIFFDAGGGHRAAAKALEFAMQDKWEVHLVNLRDVIDNVDFIKKYTGFAVENFYNNLMRSDYGYLAASKLGLWILHKIINSLHDKIVAKIIDYYSQHDTDLVVSLIPNFNRQIFEAVDIFGIPFVTIILDMVDCYENFWIERQNQYMIVGNSQSYYQAIKKIKTENVFQVRGQIVHPKFYNLPKHAFRSTLPRGLVCFGGYGSSKMKKILKVVDKYKPMLFLEFVCGYNTKLQSQLLKILTPYSINSKIYGFIDMSSVISQVDFLVGKPGPGIINEALVCGLPVMLDNSNPMIQERYNLEWIETNNIGAGGDVTNIQFLQRFIADLPYYKDHIKYNRPTAIFEIPRILETLI